MKKRNIVLKSMISLVLILGLFILTMLGILKYQQSNMSPIESSQILENIYVIRDDYSNMYLIESNGKYISIDAGISEQNLKKELEILQINPDDVVATFLTHSDSDHVGGINLFKNSTIYLPKEEVPMVDGSTYRSGFLKNKLDVDYSLIENNEEISIEGIKIKAFMTSGHTVGHTSFILDDKYLFSGDSMSLENGHVGPFIKIFTMDYEKHLESISETKNIDEIEYIFTAHFGYSDNFEEAFSNWE